MPSATTPHALPGMILREVRKAVIGKDLVLTKVLIAFLGRRSRADGGNAGRGQDDTRHGVFQGAGAELPPGAVYAGCAAL